MRPRSQLTLLSLQRDHRLLFLSSPCTMCLPSSPGPCVAPNASLLEQAVLVSGLFLLPQLISRFSSQSPTDLALHGLFVFFFSSLPVICTACPYFLLCLTHICVILISPVSLGLNLPHSSHWWLCRPPLPLVSGSITLPSSLFSFVSGAHYYWVRYPLFLFSWVVFVVCGCVLRCSCSLFPMLTDIGRSWEVWDQTTCSFLSPSNLLLASLLRFQLLHLLSFCLFHIQTVIHIFLSSSISWNC